MRGVVHGAIEAADARVPAGTRSWRAPGPDGRWDDVDLTLTPWRRTAADEVEEAVEDSHEAESHPLAVDTGGEELEHSSSVSDVAPFLAASTVPFQPPPASHQRPDDGVFMIESAPLNIDEAAVSEGTMNTGGADAEMHMSTTNAETNVQEAQQLTLDPAPAAMQAGVPDTVPQLSPMGRALSASLQGRGRVAAGDRAAVTATLLEMGCADMYVHT